MKLRKLAVPLALLLMFGGAAWVRLVYVGVGGDMTQTAQAFLASLSDAERAVATVPYDDARRVDWHFIPKDERKGLQIKDMSKAQRAKAHALLQSGLSELGYSKATQIMELEIILRELEKEREGGAIRDPERYYFTVFGKPDVQGKWGWSVEGHHLSLNFAVADGALSSTTPTFLGANPATVHHHAEGGAEIGTRVLKQEEQLAFDLVNALTAEQLKVALIDDTAPREIRAAGEAQPPSDAPVGLSAGDMTNPQKQLLRSLVEAYTSNMPDEVAQDRMNRIRVAGVPQVHFAWAGATKPGIGHYYRVQGPTFLIEFVNTQPDSKGTPANHIHSVWRNMDGDFASAQ